LCSSQLIDRPVTGGEVTIPAVETNWLLISGLKPHAKYELQMTGGRANWRGGLFNGVPGGNYIGAANGSGLCTCRQGAKGWQAAVATAVIRVVFTPLGVRCL